MPRPIGAQPASLTAEQRKLVEDNIKLAYWYVNTKIRVADSALEYEDWVQVCCVGLMRAAQRWVPERGKFSTYATQVMHTAVSHELRMQNTQSRNPVLQTISLDKMYDPNGRHGDMDGGRECAPGVNLASAIAAPDGSHEDPIKNPELAEFLRAAINSDETLHAYFEERKTMREIAAEQGITPQGVNYRIKRRLGKLRRQIEQAKLI